MKDKQFRALKKEIVPRIEYHYGRDMPLTDALEDVLNGSPLPVIVRDGRYVTVMGMQGRFCADGVFCGSICRRELGWEASISLRRTVNRRRR